MNDIEIIQRKIYEIRGQRVMLDFDLASLYGIETKVLKRSVRRNLRRFPTDFMFEISNEEVRNLRCNFGTSSWGGSRYGAFAFTELGVAMLSSILNTDLAIDINIRIMRAFVAVRQSLPVLASPGKLLEIERGLKELRQEVEDILSDQNEINEDTRAQLDALSTALVALQSERKYPSQPRRPIGFNAS